jgi:two-component system OmpR family sensor kinase
MRAGSFRARLAVRFTVLMAATSLVIGAVALLLLRHILTAQLDGTLLRLASIEASAVSDSPDSAVHFHEGIFSAPRSEHAAELVRYAEVWHEDGRPVVRSQSLGTRDLPITRDALAAAKRGEVVVVSLRWQDEPVRSVVYPLGLVGPAHQAHILQVAAPLRPVSDVLETLVRVLVALGLVVTGLTFVGAWGLASRAVRPAREIAEQAEAITAGSLEARIHAHADAAEYQRLVAVLNDMLERLEAAFDAQRRFVADAGHEVRHPVAVLRAALDLALRRDRSPEEYRAAIADAVTQTDRITALAQGLLTLARADAGVLNPLRMPHDLLILAEEAAHRARLVAERRQVVLVVRGEPAVVSVDRELVARALDNLVDNAVKFTPAGGLIEVTVEGAAAAAFVHVTDAGSGIPPEHEPHLFERFFRGDPARATDGGAGLGLAIARGIALAHGGDVTFAPHQPVGSRFTIKLPL